MRSLSAKKVEIERGMINAWIAENLTWHHAAWSLIRNGGVYTGCSYIGSAKGERLKKTDLQFQRNLKTLEGVLSKAIAALKDAGASADKKVAGPDKAYI